jgi:hypothetical protein
VRGDVPGLWEEVVRRLDFGGFSRGSVEFKFAATEILARPIRGLNARYGVQRLSLM